MEKMDASSFFFGMVFALARQGVQFFNRKESCASFREAYLRLNQEQPEMISTNFRVRGGFEDHFAHTFETQIEYLLRYKMLRSARRNMLEILVKKEEVSGPTWLGIPGGPKCFSRLALCAIKHKEGVFFE